MEDEPELATKPLQAPSDINDDQGAGRETGSSSAVSTAENVKRKKTKKREDSSKKRNEKSVEERLIKKCDKMSRQLDKLNQAKSQVDNSLVSMTSERDNLLRNVKDLNSKNEALSKNATKHEKVTKEIEKIKVAKSQLVTERDALLEKVEKFGEETNCSRDVSGFSRGSLDEELKKTKSELEKLRKCFADSNSNKESTSYNSETSINLQRQIDNIMREKDEIREMLQKITYERDNIRSKLDGVTFERDEMAERLHISEELIKEVNKLSDDKVQAEEVMENMKSECESLRIKASDTSNKDEAQIKLIKSQLSTEIEKNKVLTKKNTKSAKKIDELEDSIEKSQIENEEVLQSIDATFQRRLDAISAKSDNAAEQIKDLTFVIVQMKKDTTDLIEEKDSVKDELLHVTNERDFFSRTASQLTQELDKTTLEFGQMKSTISQMQENWTPPRNNGRRKVMQWMSRRTPSSHAREKCEESEVIPSRGQWSSTFDDVDDDDESFEDIKFPTRDTVSTVDAESSSSTKESNCENARAAVVDDEPNITSKPVAVADSNNRKGKDESSMLWWGTEKEEEEKVKPKDLSLEKDQSEQQRPTGELSKQSSARKELDRNQFQYIMYT